MIANFTEGLIIFLKYATKESEIIPYERTFLEHIYITNIYGLTEEETEHLEEFGWKKDYTHSGAYTGAWFFNCRGTRQD